MATQLVEVLVIITIGIAKKKVKKGIFIVVLIKKIGGGGGARLIFTIDTSNLLNSIIATS